jgi:hypothetical protein
MKRRTSTAPIRIYTYGCRLPTQGVELVEQQLLLAHRYYNKLIEIERDRRKKTRVAQSASSEDVIHAESALAIYETEIVGVLDTIKAKKGAARAAKVEAAEERAVLVVLRDMKRKTIDVLRVAKLAARTPELLAEFATIQEVANAEVRDARSKCGVYWGTYLLVEQAVQAARKNREDPEFRRFESVPNRQGQLTIARGRVGVELIHGAPAATIMAGTDTRLQIHMEKSDSKRGQTMARVKIRVGTAEDKRSPIFAEFPFRMHRPLPADGVVKWAWISKSIKGRWVDWSLQVVVEAASLHWQVRQPSNGGVVAFDIGWRIRPHEVANELRVAYWHDDQGNHGELVLPSDDRVRVDSRGRKHRPESIRGRLDHATSLRSIEDKNFDAIRSELVVWKTGHDLPEWFANALEWLHMWKAPRKLGAVIDQWRSNRFSGDDEMFAKVEMWWKQHRHLYDWESCERDRALNSRKNIFRQWAAQFTRKYAVVVLEDNFLAEVAKLQAPDSMKTDMPQLTRRNRTVAACSEFVLALKNAAPGNGCAVDVEPCEDTTAMCARCGYVERFDHRPLTHTCERCGDVSGPADQDRTAAENLLAAYVGKTSCSQSASEDDNITGDSDGSLAIPAQEGVS